jgi:hypothetical protein
MSDYGLRSLEVTEFRGEILWVAVVLAAAILPMISALTAKRRSGNLAKRWIICWIANIGVFCLVLFGFMFQGLVDYAITQPDPFFGDQYSPFHLSWWQKGTIYLKSVSFSTQGLAAIVLLSLIISWATLFGKNRRQWAIFGCRAAFLAYVIVDIVLAIVNDSSIQELMKNLVFDLIGAILFGAVASVLISLIFGEMSLRRRPVDVFGKKLGSPV